MAFKLAIAAVLVASLQFTMNDEGKDKQFKFKLHFDRLSEKDWDARIRNADGKVDQACIKQTLIDITRGWDGQTLVIDDETNEPASFSREACEVMYSTPGFTDVALGIYLKEVQAKVKI